MKVRIKIDFRPLDELEPLQQIGKKFLDTLVEFPVMPRIGDKVDLSSFHLNKELNISQDELENLCNTQTVFVIKDLVICAHHIEVLVTADVGNQQWNWNLTHRYN